jgi:hypothetical protein
MFISHSSKSYAEMMQTKSRQIYAYYCTLKLRKFYRILTANTGEKAILNSVLKERENLEDQYDPARSSRASVLQCRLLL